MCQTKLFLTLFLLSHSLLGASKPQPHSTLSNTLSLLPVPIVRQATSYSCGAASALAVLYYWKIYDGGEFSLHEGLKTDKSEGTHPQDLTDYLSKLGLTVRFKQNATWEELTAALAKKETTIVGFQAWPDKPTIAFKDVWDDGHYAVVVGMDENQIFFMDPSIGTGYGVLSKASFMDRWHDIETRYHKIERFIQPAIFISGKHAMESFPGKILPVE